MNPAGRAPSYSGGDAAAARDAILVQRMARGDERALGELYDRWDGRIRAVASDILGEPMEAEEVVEDVFWQAWRQSERFDATRGNVGGWLVTIARSRALDRRRAVSRARDDEALGEDTPDDAAVDAQAALERTDVTRQVQAALDGLPPVQRDVIDLAFYQGLSQSEIAERRGQPLGTIKTRMRLALLKLRERLGQRTP